MKITIIGSKGQLGSELCGILASGKSEISPIPVLYQNADVTAVDLEELDIRDAEAVNAFITKRHPDLIINCAAYTNVDACESHENDAYPVNAVGPGNLAAAAETIGAKFVHISTDYVFDGNGPDGKQIPYRETDIPNPVSAYGRTKLKGEEEVLSKCTRAFIVRTAWLYSYGPKNFVRTMIRLGKEKDIISVVNDQIGTPTFTPDLAHQILKLAATESYGIFHCTGKGQCSWYDFASEIIRLSGSSARVLTCSSEDYPSPTKRPAWSVLSHDKMEQTVGDESRDWETALKSFFANEKEHA